MLVHLNTNTGVKLFNFFFLLAQFFYTASFKLIPDVTYLLKKKNKAKNV